MKKILSGSLIVLSLAFVSCGGKNDKKTVDEKKAIEEKVDTPKETAAAIAKQWCDLNGIAHRAADADKEAAKAAVKAFEESMKMKYGSDKAFMDEIGKEVEKCEDASEGR